METGKYYYSRKMTSSFEDAINHVTELLSNEGFGIITEVDVKATMKKKLDKDFRQYKILGACNPGYAFQALSIEDKVGTMLPCNVIVQELDNGEIEIAAISPKASMMAVANDDLISIAEEVENKLISVIEKI